MDLDDYDYLELALELSEPLKDEHQERKKGDDDRRKQSDGRRSSRASDEAPRSRHERHKHSDGRRSSRASDEATISRHDGHKHNPRTEEKRAPADGADGSERVWDQSGSGLKKGWGRPSCDRERWEQDNRERKRRDKDWNREKVGGGGLGGRERFYGNYHSRGSAGEMEGRHFDKQVDMKHGFSEVHIKLGGFRE